MTTNAMSCELFNDRLMDYLEHETDDATRAGIERHAVTCPECGALLADLRKLRGDAANLPQLVPSHDLWNGIAERIEAPVVSIDGARTDVRRTTYGDVRIARRLTRSALIAASLVGAGAIGYFVASRRDVSVPVPPVAAAQMPETVYRVASSAQDSAAQLSQPVISGAAERPGVRLTTAQTPIAAASNDISHVVETMSRDYDREIVRLRALIEQRRNQMDPVTVAIIEKNLQVIDAAILECKKAIARDPASRFLIESLNQSFQTKVELMRTAALLPTRT